MIYLTSSDIYALINYTGFATWVRNIETSCLAPPSVVLGTVWQRCLFEITGMLGQILSDCLIDLFSIIDKEALYYYSVWNVKDFYNVYTLQNVYEINHI